MQYRYYITHCTNTNIRESRDAIRWFDVAIFTYWCGDNDSLWEYTVSAHVSDDSGRTALFCLLSNDIHAH